MCRPPPASPARAFSNNTTPAPLSLWRRATAARRSPTERRAPLSSSSRPPGENGHEIGCHTYSHPAVRYLNDEQINLELERNRAALEKIDPKVELRNFAYPFGDISIRTKRHLEAHFD